MYACNQDCQVVDALGVDPGFMVKGDDGEPKAPSEAR